jgi:hypothetical protein
MIILTEQNEITKFVNEISEISQSILRVATILEYSEPAYICEYKGETYIIPIKHMMK